MTEISCYTCIYCQKQYDDDTVDCEMKGKGIDVHAVCLHYTEMIE